MAQQKNKGSVIATTAQSVLRSTDYKKLVEQHPEDALPCQTPNCNFVAETEKSQLAKSDLKQHVQSVNDKHAWAIFLEEKLVSTQKTEGGVEHYLIGYENGLTARQNETHFTQKENDPVSHRIIFQPDPHYVSYSFFYGFFEQTIRTLCLKTIYGADYAKNKTMRSLKKTDVGIRELGQKQKKEILKKFNDKYSFAFTKNPALVNLMNAYAETLIENVIEVRENLGNGADLKGRRRGK